MARSKEEGGHVLGDDRPLRDEGLQEPRFRSGNGVWGMQARSVEQLGERLGFLACMRILASCEPLGPPLGPPLDAGVLRLFGGRKRLQEGAADLASEAVEAGQRCGLVGVEAGRHLVEEACLLAPQALPIAGEGLLAPAPRVHRAVPHAERASHGAPCGPAGGRRAQRSSPRKEGANAPPSWD
jgi:hypothetical protein